MHLCEILPQQNLYDQEAPVAAKPPSAELMALMHQATSLPPPPLPTPQPRDGQPYTDWVREVERIRRAHEDWVKATAAALADDAPASAPVGAVRDIADGPVRARVFTPAGEGPFPVVISFHGGGFWIGGGPVGMDSADGACRLMCLRLGAVVVHVDYRQAPEHRFPTPLEDCYAATRWVVDHAGELQVDIDRLALCGPSAGANLAAAVGLLLRDRGGARPRLLVLMVPAADATLSSPSIEENGRDYDISSEMVAGIWTLYLGPAGDPREPLASLLHHPDLSGLPATHVVVGEFDPLRDDGLRLAERLEKSGVDVTVSRFPMGHGVATQDVGERYLRDVLDRLAGALSG